MKIMIIGAGGQLGSELVNILQDDNIIPLTHLDIEITDYQKMNDIISSNLPDIVINTSAYHRVDECEDNIEKSFSVNAFAVRNLAWICSELNAILVHFSTDYVFGGEKNNKGSIRSDSDPHICQRTCIKGLPAYKDRQIWDLSCYK